MIFRIQDWEADPKKAIDVQENGTGAVVYLVINPDEYPTYLGSIDLDKVYLQELHDAIGYILNELKKEK